MNYILRKYFTCPAVWRLVFLQLFLMQVNIHSFPGEPETQQPDSSRISFPGADNLIEKESVSGFLNESPIKPIKDIAVTGINDTWALLKSPFDWDSTIFFVIPPVILTTWFLMILDKPVTYDLLEDKRYYDSYIIKAAEHYGRNSTLEISSVGFTLAGIALNDKKLIRIGLEIYEAYFFANNIHSVAKRLIGRARPYENQGAFSFEPFGETHNPQNALPSGHATLSFTLSTVLAAHVDNIYLKGLIYAPAVLTCFSRVYQNYHWLSDVFLGAALGYFVGSFVVNRHNNEEQNFFSVGLDEQGRMSLVIPLR